MREMHSTSWPTEPANKKRKSKAMPGPMPEALIERIVRLVATREDRLRSYDLDLQEYLPGFTETEAEAIEDELRAIRSSGGWHVH